MAGRAAAGRAGVGVGRRGEKEEGCWDLLRGLAASGTLLAGKLVATWLWLVTTWALSAALVVVALGVPLSLAVLELDPTDPDATLTLGFTLAVDGSPDAAAVLQRFLDVAPLVHPGRDVAESLLDETP